VEKITYFGLCVRTVNKKWQNHVFVNCDDNHLPMGYDRKGNKLKGEDFLRKRERKKRFLNVYVCRIACNK